MSTPTHVLLVDDEDKLRQLLARIIGLEGYAVHQAPTAAAALTVLAREAIQVVICDVKLPDAHGVAFVQTLKARHPTVEIILLTAYGTIADGVRAVQHGAFDYLTKGDDNDRILPLLSRAADKAHLQQKVQRLERQMTQRQGFDSIIGQSAALHAAIALARRVAATPTTVLLLGETGTGKEVFAQAIHCEGPRRDRPFVALNCSTFGRELLESELFGHRAGAFTGATRDKRGLLEEAHEGTLFLDEIGEMPLDLQARLLRVLETGEYYKVGDTRPSHARVRVIAATNRALAAEAEAGRFRDDLYYRLAVFQINLPPLRERPEDVPALAAHFARVYADKLNRKNVILADDFMDALRQHPWRGNIRELKNVLERALILTDDGTLRAADLPFATPQAAPGSATPFDPLTPDLASVERAHIARVLAEVGGNKTEAAHRLGIGLTTLYRKLEEARPEEKP